MTIAEREPLKKAVAKRRREFAAGRFAAKRCAQRLGQPLFSLLIGQQREPCWPDQLMGTITHDSVSALAWLAPAGEVKGLGLDVERLSRLQKQTWRLLFTQQELILLANTHDKELALTFFSAKESVYKCLFPTVKRFVGYKEVCIEPLSEGHLLCRPDPSLAEESGIAQLEVRTLRTDHRLATWVWLEAG